MSSIEIKTPRLTLRTAEPDDVEAMHAVLSHPVAMAYWSTPPHRDIAQTRAWIDTMIQIPPQEGEDFIVTYEGRLIGKAGLFRFPEVGFIFDPSVWGRGFAREALQAVIERAFEVHGLPSLEADVDPRNQASLKLLSGLGFGVVGRAERTLLVGDAWCDSIYLRLDRHDRR